MEIGSHNSGEFWLGPAYYPRGPIPCVLRTLPSILHGVWHLGFKHPLNPGLLGHMVNVSLSELW